MKGNYGRDKRRIEESKRKRREEKRLKRLAKPADGVSAEGTAADPQPGTDGPPTPTTEMSV